jgi:integrase
MPRARGKDGWVKETGKAPKTWTGYWYEYIIEDGTERRIGPKSKVLGKKADITKHEAEAVLASHLKSILATNRAVRANADIKTFEDAATLYLSIKRAQWEGFGFHGVMTSIFERHILPRIGKRPLEQIVKTEVQALLNGIAVQNNASESLLKKVRTHVRAVFEMAVDDNRILRNPAQKLVLPKHKVVDATFFDLDSCQRLLAAAERYGTVRDVVFLKILILLGLRPGECVAFRVNDILENALKIDETSYELGVLAKAGYLRMPLHQPLP